jgi:hypothetical protein
MIRQRMIAGLVAATALVGLTACGSDSESSSTTAEAATTTQEADTPTTKAGATTLPGGVTVPPNMSIPELTGDCVELQEGMPDLTNASQIDQDELDAYYDKLKAAVPSDLKDDVSTVQTAIQPFYDALARAGGDMSKAIQDADAQKAMQAMSDPKVSASLQELSTWVSNGCK